MADFFGDIWGALSGQQKAIPYTPNDINAALMQGAGGAAAANLAYNRAYGPGAINLQLELENLVNPNIGALRSDLIRLQQANLASEGRLSPETQRAITQSALQSGAASGFNLSVAGRGNAARQLGFTTDQLARMQRSEALQTLQGVPQFGDIYRPSQSFNPADVSGAYLQEQNVANQRQADEFIRKESNKIALYNTFGRVAGTALGGAFGGAAGAQIGGQIGGSVFTNPYKANTGGGGGGLGGLDYTSILKTYFGGQGGIGGAYGGTAGQQYMDAGGNVQTSVRAAPYTGFGSAQLSAPTYQPYDAGRGIY